MHGSVFEADRVTRLPSTGTFVEKEGEEEGEDEGELLPSEP